MSARTLAALNTAQAHDFNPTVFHRVHKELIARSIATGLRVKALCGRSQVFNRVSQGSVYGTGQGVMCPLCELLWEGVCN